MATNLGRVMMVYQGDYSAIKQYVKLDVVTYNGSAYVCTSSIPIAGIVPTDLSKWGVIALKGEIGITGAKGDKGDKGDTGITGIKGDKGDKGETGAVGAKGDVGPIGPVNGLKIGDTLFGYDTAGKITITDEQFEYEVLTRVASKLTESVSDRGVMPTLQNVIDGLSLKPILHIQSKFSGSEGGPSPEFPWTIERWKQVGFRERGRNLFKPSEEGSFSGLTIVYREDGAIVINGTTSVSVNRNMIVRLPEGQYTISEDEGAVITGDVQIKCTYWNYSTKTYADYTSSFIRMNGSTPRRITFDAPNGIYSTQIYANRDVTLTNLVIKPMLVKGATATPYEPYLGQDHTIQLPQEVGGLPGYEDYVDFERGVLVVRSGKILFNGSETGWAKATSVNNSFYFDYYHAGIDSRATTEPAICNLFKKADGVLISIDKHFNHLIYGDGILRRVIFRDSSFTTLDDWKAGVAANYSAGIPLTVIHKLATPLEIPLSSLPNPISLPNVTHAWMDVPGEVEISGQLTPQSVHTEMDTRIADLESHTKTPFYHPDGTPWNRDSMDILRLFAEPKSNQGSIATLEGIIDGLPLNPILHIQSKFSGPEGGPSPEFPWTIERWKQVGLPVRGRNFLQPDRESAITHGLTCTYNPDNGLITITGTPMLTGALGIPINKIVPPGTYHLSVMRINGSSKVFCNYYAIDTGIWKGDVTTDAPTKTLPMRYRLAAVGIFATQGVEVNDQFRPQLELGATATPYEPYLGQDHTIQLPQEVGGLPGYEDYVDFERGVLVVQNKQFVLTAASSVGIYAGMPVSGHTVFMLQLLDSAVGLQTSKCTHLPNIDGTWSIAREAYSDHLTNQNKYFVVSNERLGVTDSTPTANRLMALKTWLGDNPMTFLYQLATPLEIPLSSLPNPISLPNVTHAWMDVPGEVEISGLVNPKFTLSKQQSEINEIRTALDKLLP